MLFGWWGAHWCACSERPSFLCLASQLHAALNCLMCIFLIFQRFQIFWVALCSFSHVAAIKDSSSHITAFSGANLSRGTVGCSYREPFWFWQVPVREGRQISLLRCLVKREAVWSCWTTASSQRERAETDPRCPVGAAEKRREMGSDG